MHPDHFQFFALEDHVEKCGFKAVFIILVQNTKQRYCDFTCKAWFGFILLPNAFNINIPFSKWKDYNVKIVYSNAQNLFSLVLILK